VSGCNGQFGQRGQPLQSATILFIDCSYHRGSLIINGEYGRSNIVGWHSAQEPSATRRRSE